MTLAEVAAVVGGRTAGGGDGTTVTGPASLDSREVGPGGLFVAVAGERVDGHDFVDAAAAAGAAAVLGTRPTALPTVVVDDVATALGRLARHVRDELARRGPLTVLAMTGSQGKTGTKDYLAHLLAAAGPTVATRGNLNNELGVPLTVLRASEATRFLVVEMGARGIGHVGYLCEVARPDVAAVLNVGSAHLGEFGSREAIARAKGEIVEALAPDGTAVLNAADPLVAPMAARTGARVLTFAVRGGAGGDATAGGAADVVAEGLSTDDLDRPRFTLRHGAERAEVALLQVGAHQAANATAAAAMALAAGVPLAAAAAALGSARAASPHRSEVTELPDGTVVVDDTYNANPDAMRAALATLAVVGERRRARRVAVLGEMRELGEDEVRAHRELGEDAVAAGVDVLVVVGPLAAHAARAAESARVAGRWHGETVLTPDRDGAVSWVRENVAAGDVVLVKASRGAALEHVAAAVLDRPGAARPGDPRGTRPTDATEDDEETIR